ncbi:hypothetical protein [Bacillus pseudomycoides]|nr:hypothetical protein [Bacillus pseudomycoides]
MTKKKMTELELLEFKIKVMKELNEGARRKAENDRIYAEHVKKYGQY